MAIDFKARKPSVELPSLLLVRFSGRSLAHSHRFAKVCRVANVVRPYLESVA
jgi:hypothetical protein